MVTSSLHPEPSAGNLSLNMAEADGNKGEEDGKESSGSRIAVGRGQRVVLLRRHRRRGLEGVDGVYSY
jgi:hypothetical protein